MTITREEWDACIMGLSGLLMSSLKLSRQFGEIEDHLYELWFKLYPFERWLIEGAPPWPFLPPPGYEPPVDVAALRAEFAELRRR